MRRHAPSGNEDGRPRLSRGPARADCPLHARKEQINYSFAVNPRRPAARCMRNRLKHSPCVSSENGVNPRGRHAVRRGSDAASRVQRNKCPASTPKQGGWSVKQ